MKLYILLTVFFLPVIKLTAQQKDKVNEALNAKQQSIVTISAFTANGDMPSLRRSLNEGLDAQLTVSEIKEVLVQLYAYAGFPRSLNALNTFMAVLKERKEKGINDLQGTAPKPFPEGKTKLQFGTEMQTKLVGSPVRGEVYTFAPAIDQFLKEHLFGDIFGRDNLDFKTRELATIAALASLGRAENQLRSHMGVGMYNGLTADQLTQIVSIIQRKVYEKEGIIADSVLRVVLNRGKDSSRAAAQVDATTHDGTVFPRGQKITNNNFTGNAWLAPLIASDTTNETTVGNVTFEAGARTDWHFHPGGQILLVISGTGYYQEKGSAKRIIRKGDAIKCPPNVHHWHGAAANSEFVQVAVTSTRNGPTVWLGRVTDGEYGSE